MEDLPTPASFSGETPPERIIGSEWEGTVQSENYGKVDIDAFLTPPKMATKLGGLAFQRDGRRFYLSNGAKVYADCNNAEYASAEAAGPVDAAAADLAGIQVLGSIVEASGLPHRGLFRTSGATAISETAEVASFTCGYHGNYLVGTETARGAAAHQLVPSHLASSLWAMSGTLQQGGYAFSQKAAGLGGDAVEHRLDRRTASGKKPMALFHLETSESDVMNSHDGWTRVETRYGDPGLSPTAKYLEFATMSLILRLAEHSKVLSGLHLSQWSLEQPAEAAKTFSSDLSLRRTARTVEGKRVTALDIQDALAEAALFLSNEIEIPPSEQQALSLWPAVNDGMRQSHPNQVDYPKIIYDIVNFAPKHRYLTRHHTEAELAALAPEAVQRSLMWDRVSPQGTGLQYWAKVGSEVVSAEAIAERTRQAPTETRAHVRSSAIADPRVHILDMTWSTIRHLTRGLQQDVIDMSNPYRTDTGFYRPVEREAA